MNMKMKVREFRKPDIEVGPDGNLLPSWTRFWPRETVKSRDEAIAVMVRDGQSAYDTAAINVVINSAVAAGWLVAVEGGWLRPRVDVVSQPSTESQSVEPNVSYDAYPFVKTVTVTTTDGETVDLPVYCEVAPYDGPRSGYAEHRKNNTRPYNPFTRSNPDAQRPDGPR